MSDSDIHKILPEVEIIKYRELSEYSNIQELLPKTVDAVIILIETNLDRGHWVGLARLDNQYMYFDSYGIRFDNELKWISLKQRKNLDELTPYLTRLLEGNNYDYNKIHYQQSDSDISTCGMHVTYFLYNVLNNNMNLYDYHKYMQTLREQYHRSYDYIVTEWVADFQENE